MSPVTRLVTGLAVVIATGAVAALAADSAVTYPDVVPGKPLEFPRDEGSHPEYRTEWWYVTGWLQDAAQPGKPLGFQVTFFRVARVSREQPEPLRATTSPVRACGDRRPGLRQAATRHSARRARALNSPTRAPASLASRIDDWSLAREGDGYHASIDDDACRWT